MAFNWFSKIDAGVARGCGVRGAGVWLRPTQFTFRKGLGRRRKRAFQNEGNPDSQNSRLGCPVLVIPTGVEGPAASRSPAPSANGWAPLPAVIHSPLPGGLVSRERKGKGGPTGPPASWVHLVTVRLTVVEWCRVPLVPVIVKVYVPVPVLRFVETVSVEFFGEGGSVSDAGLNVQVLRGGQPVTLRLTVPANPFKAVTVVV